MHRLLRVRGPVSVRRDSTNFGSHSPKHGADELVVKPVSGSMVTFANVKQDSIMNASAVRSPVTDASSTIDANTLPEKSSAMISTLKALPRDG
jgi:hypothetical protein